MSDLDDFADNLRKVNPAKVDNVDDIDNDLIGVTDRFLSIKPYIGALHDPTDCPDNDASLPDNNLELDWVYGYRCHDSRNNIYTNTDGDIIYPTASLLVKYNFKKHSQQYFKGHTDDVISVTQNPNNLDIIASGQVATIVNRHSTNPHICIWNSKTNEQWILPALHKRAIRTLAFSTCGTYLASVGNDNSQEMIIWDWQNKSKICSCKTISLPKKVFQIVWNSDHEIMLVGMKTILYFTLKKLIKVIN